MKKTFDEVVLFARTGLNPRQNFKLGQGHNAYITIKNIKNNSLIIDENTDVVDDEAIKLIHKRSQIKKGDILFASIGRMGDMYIIDEEPTDWDINESVFAFTLDTSIVRQKYFYYIFRVKSTLDYLASNSSGSTFKSIKMNQLKKMIFDIPSLEEQDLIVKLLDNVCNVIEMRKQEVSALDNLIKARFVELFGDPIVNEKGWDTKPLLELGSCKNGMNFHYEDAGVEVNCLGVGDFKDYSIISDTSILPTVSLNEMPSADYMLQDDDIVFVRSNGNKALVGRSVAVYPKDVPTTFSGFCIRYRKMDKAVNIPYLLRVLKAESVRQKMVGRGANIQNLNQQILGTLIIPVPPIVLQNEFAAFIEQVDKSKLLLLTASKYLDALKKYTSYFYASIRNITSQKVKRMIL